MSFFAQKDTLNTSNAPDNASLILQSKAEILSDDGYGLTALLPPMSGNNIVGGYVLQTSSSSSSGLVWTFPGSGGTGNVVGPVSSTNNAITLFNGTTGQLIQNSTTTLNPTTGVLAFPSTATISMSDVRLKRSGVNTFMMDNNSTGACNLSLNGGTLTCPTVSNSSTSLSLNGSIATLSSASASIAVQSPDIILTCGLNGNLYLGTSGSGQVVMSGSQKIIWNGGDVRLYRNDIASLVVTDSTNTVANGNLGCGTLYSTYFIDLGSGNTAFTTSSTQLTLGLGLVPASADIVRTYNTFACAMGAIGGGGNCNVTWWKTSDKGRCMLVQNMAFTTGGGINNAIVLSVDTIANVGTPVYTYLDMCVPITTVATVNPGLVQLTYGASIQIIIQPTLNGVFSIGTPYSWNSFVIHFKVQ